MSAIQPAELSALLPLKDSEAVFRCGIHLDGSFKGNTDFYKTWKLDTNGPFPQHQEYVAYKKNNERWNIGIHMYEAGGDVFYQVFYWLGGLPNFENKELKNSGDWKRVSTPERYNPSDFTTVISTDIPSYKWLKITAQQVDIDFDLSVIRSTLTNSQASLTPVIAKSTCLRNESDHETQSVQKFGYKKEETLTYTVSDTHSVKAGLKLTWSKSVKFGPATTNFEVQFSLEYGYSHTSTSSETTKRTYVVDESLTIPVPPESSVWASIILHEDDNASAEIQADLKLQGRMNGTPLTGAYLKEMLEAIPGVTIIKEDADDVVYQINGTIVGNIVSHSEILVTSHEPHPEFINEEPALMKAKIEAEPVLA